MSEYALEVYQKVKVATLVVLPLVGVLVAIVFLWNRYVFASDLWLLLALYILTTLGIGVGYHRMLTHRSFLAPAPIRAFWLILGCMAFEGPPDVWAATHLKHHAHSDEEGDPHSPLEGFWHAHMGWLFSWKNFADPKTYAPHLLKDPVVVFVSTTAGLWMLLSVLLPFLIGGLTGLVWGGGVRIFLHTHMAWSVNSVCHCFGRRDFETADESRNHWFVGLLCLGEGWHNNHHAFPQSAMHGLRWWQFDLSALLIRLQEKLNLISNVHYVRPETMEAYRIRSVEKRSKLEELRFQLLSSLERAEKDVEASFSTIIEDSLSSFDREALTAVNTAAHRRLKEIRLYASKATNLRKQKIQQYGEEVAQLVSDVKGSTRRLTMLRA